MHACEARRFRVRPWLVNLGTLLVKLDYTTGRFQLDLTDIRRDEAARPQQRKCRSSCAFRTQHR